MTPPLAHKALRRKIAAHQPAAPSASARDEAAVNAFGRALRRAAMPFDGLGLALGQMDIAVDQPLHAVIAALPSHGLVAALEDEQGRRGLVGLSAGLVDALIEVQTTGRVEATELPPRPVTRIDEALARDFIDLALAGFAQEGQPITGRDWPARMAYGSRIRDRGQINLLLPEGAHTLLQGEVGFQDVARRAQFVLALPRIAGATAGADAGSPKMPDAAWLAARERLLAELPLCFEVVLMRLIQPLAKVERLAVGDLIPFSAADLHHVALEDDQGRALYHGRLGQIGGKRALRLPSMPQTGAKTAGNDLITDPIPGPITDIPDTALSAARRATG